jgi:hypothetical protein
MEIFNGPGVVSLHKGAAFGATYKDAVADQDHRLQPHIS